ncbi:hypothetical protein Vadar_024524 [Vaccinium darrowii]|uniref:Uncharacterized protein n=1 Tax=Vaccinium darrowii TaxID=229202 RepID=A0ACB7XK05_9ERIC|nr:hypothetical protein Vadar_024524 [Vaccinium darrowii]
MGAEGPTKYVLEKLNETKRVFGAENWTNYALEKLSETERDMGVGEWIKYVVEKLMEFLVVLENFGKIIIAVAFVVTLFRWCCSGKVGKMMVAPGTGRAFKIPRSSFEANPRLYFCGLRRK